MMSALIIEPTSAAKCGESTNRRAAVKRGRRRNPLLAQQLAPGPALRPSRRRVVRFARRGRLPSSRSSARRTSERARCSTGSSGRRSALVTDEPGRDARSDLRRRCVERVAARSASSTPAGSRRDDVAVRARRSCCRPRPRSREAAGVSVRRRRPHRRRPRSTARSRRFLRRRGAPVRPRREQGRRPAHDDAVHELHALGLGRAVRRVGRARAGDRRAPRRDRRQLPAATDAEPAAAEQERRRSRWRSWAARTSGKSSLLNRLVGEERDAGQRDPRDDARRGGHAVSR